MSLIITILLTLKRISTMKKKYKVFCFSTMSGIFGGHSVLFCKMVTELFQTAILFGTTSTSTSSSQSSQLTEYEKKYMIRPFFLLILLLMLFCVTVQIFYLNKAFQCEGQVLKVMPIFQTWWVFFSIISALFFFNDFSQLDDINKVVFICGVLTTKMGLYILFITQNKDNKSTRSILEEFSEQES